MKALLLIDLQNDFFPGGALAVSSANDILPKVQQLMNEPFDYIIATKDWHPPNHKSFAIHHQRQPGEVILLNNFEQVLWPVHCVQHSYGAEFYAGCFFNKIDSIIYKGTHPEIDSYSAFFDNQSQSATGLEAYLRSKKVSELYIAGLATEYCVKNTVLDALKLKFKVFVFFDACRGVNLNQNDSEQAMQEMARLGAIILKDKK